ncbi:MAG: hypothetical protein GF364_21755 [Candidatus Lokiarchaeota archaeon]|nr:hypothetical protein [Candidatus Lokiarchaeota archaeon]
MAPVIASINVTLPVKSIEKAMELEDEFHFLYNIEQGEKYEFNVNFWN